MVSRARSASWLHHVSLLLLVLLTGCGTSFAANTSASSTARVPEWAVAPTGSVTTPTTGPTPRQVRNPALLTQLREAQSLRIEDSWWVYGPIPTGEMIFELRRDGANFTGTGNYAATSNPALRTATTRQITIPEAAIVDFVTILADAPLREGAYEPVHSHSDYNPNLRIDVRTPTGVIFYYSRSQPEGHVPWGATIARRSYIIDTAHPYDALTLLEPYLQRKAMLNALEATIEATRRALPTVTPLPPEPCRAPVAHIPTQTPVILPTPLSDAPHVAPGAQPRVGELINLAHYFALIGSDFLDVGGNFAPFSVRGQQQVAPFVAALDRDSIVGSYRYNPQQAEAILITYDSQGRPVNLTYTPRQGLIYFGVNGQSYVTPAPPAFRDLFLQAICTRPQ